MQRKMMYESYIKKSHHNGPHVFLQRHNVVARGHVVASIPGEPDIRGEGRHIDGRTILIGLELKTGKGRISDWQALCQKRYDAMGGAYIVARDAYAAVSAVATSIGVKP